MENGERSEISKMIEEIKNALKSEMEVIKSELKENIKSEVEDIRTEIRKEVEQTISREAPRPRPRVRPGHFRPFDDFTEGPNIPPVEDYSGSEQFRNESNSNTREFDLAGFTGVQVGGAFKVEIRQSDTFRVSVTAEDSLFRNLNVSKDGDTLSVNHSRHVGWRAQLTRPRIEIEMPVIRELRLSGAVGAEISGFNSSENFRLDLSGASRVNGDITAGNVEFELSGASRARLTGSATDALVKVSGANHLDLHDFAVNNAAVKLSGASHVTANVSGRLDARLSGASHFSWVGNPVMGDIRTSGASRLSRYERRSEERN